MWIVVILNMKSQASIQLAIKIQPLYRKEYLPEGSVAGSWNTTHLIISSYTTGTIYKKRHKCTKKKAYQELLLLQVLLLVFLLLVLKNVNVY